MELRIFSGGCASSNTVQQAATTASSTGASSLSEEVVPNYVGTLIPTFTNRTGDSYTIGAYLCDGEVVADYSYLKDYVTDDGSSLTLSDLDIVAQGSGFSAVAVQGSDNDSATTVYLDNLSIDLSDDEDGTNALDFTGLGAAILASGVSENAHSKMLIDHLDMTTTGFVRDGIIVNDYADAIITDSSIVVHGANPLLGGDAYEGYRNSANQSYMVSPPWVLGITGGARAANVMGTDSSLTIADSTVESGGWALLSTDSCTRPQINVVNSDLKITHADMPYGMEGGADLFCYATPYGSGYGSYAIGDSDENFYGTSFSDVTYATIMTGSGPLYYGPSASHMELKNAVGSTIYSYDGEARDTVVCSVWGLLDHRTGTAQLDAGSIWNTEEATILKKGNGESTYTVTGAQLNPASGIIFQMMDDDDGYGTSLVQDTASTTYDGQSWGQIMFSGGWYEIAGSAGLPGMLGVMSAGGSVVATLELKSGDYTGDVYNGAGSGSGVDASGMAVIITGATLSGAISSTQLVHGLPYSAEAISRLDRLASSYDKGIAYQGAVGGPNGDGTYTVKYALLDGTGAVISDAGAATYIQMLEFTCREYYLLGHVLNFPSEGATVEVALQDGAQWNVTGESHLTYLSIAEGCMVTVAEDARLTVGNAVLTGSVAAGTYGTQAQSASNIPETGGDGGASNDAGSQNTTAVSTSNLSLDTSHVVELSVSEK